MSTPDATSASSIPSGTSRNTARSVTYSTSHPFSRGATAAEGEMRHLLDELGDAAVTGDVQAAVDDRDLGALRLEGAAEDDLAGMLRDVDEAAGGRPAGRRGAKR